jgi:serine/threonine protein phosphatase PrpC
MAPRELANLRHFDSSLGGTPAPEPSGAAVSTELLHAAASEPASQPGDGSNHDRVFLHPELQLFGVADACGYSFGRRLSSPTVDPAIEVLVASLRDPLDSSQGEERLWRALRRASAIALLPTSGSPMDGRPTASLACLYFHGEGVTAGRLGSCRAYRLRNGNLTTLLADRGLVSGSGGPPDDRVTRGPVVTPAFGFPAAEVAEAGTTRVQPGDLYLLCSDGVWTALPDERLASVLWSGAEHPAEAAAAVLAPVLVARHDDASVVVVQVV